MILFFFSLLAIIIGCISATVYIVESESKKRTNYTAWKNAQGDDLPEIDTDVIVLCQPYPLENDEYIVSFAHRPNPDGWDGKSISTGKVENFTPKTYDKGGWSIPRVMWWLDLEFPEGGEK